MSAVGGTRLLAFQKSRIRQFSVVFADLSTRRRQESNLDSALPRPPHNERILARADTPAIRWGSSFIRCFAKSQHKYRREAA
jgi:hypothetical protein